MARNLEQKEKRGVIAKLAGESEEKLLSVSTPEKTETYTPVPYSLIINSIKKELAWRNFTILSVDYRTSNNGNRVVGIYKFAPADEPMSNEPDRIERTIAFRSSHDKTMSFGVFSGASVSICVNGMYSGEISYTKKHITNVDEMVKEKIHEQLNLIEATFEDLKKFRLALKETILSEKVYAQIMGRLIFEKNILSSTQINIVKDHRRFSKYFSDNSAWSLYNNVTESLKSTNPILFHKNHVILHDLFSEVIFGL